MARTKNIVYSSYRYGLNYPNKSKRARVSLLKRSTYHSLRVHNFFADELTHQSLRHYPKRKYYHVFNPPKEVLRTRLDCFHNLLFED